MPKVVVFPQRTTTTDDPTKKYAHLGDKLQAIARLSPDDVDPFDVLADVVLRRLSRERPQRDTG